MWIRVGVDWISCRHHALIVASVQLAAGYGRGGNMASQESESSSSNCPSGSRIIADCSETVPSTTDPPKLCTAANTSPRSETDGDSALRIVEKLEHQAVPDEICRMQSDRFVQLQKLVGALVGRIEFPPKL